MQGLNHRQLQAFRAVIISGSMTGAGRILNISQPAVSRLIQDFEAELQLTLFHRHGARVTATEEALKLYRDVERYFSNVQRIRDSAAHLRTSKGGQLRIAAMPTLSSGALPEAIRRFKISHPDVDFFVHSDTSMHIVDSLTRNEFDLGFGRVPPERTDIRRLEMPKSEAVCLIPLRHPLAKKCAISARDLNGEPFVALGTSSLLRLQVESVMQLSGIRVGPTVQTLYSNTVASYVALGLGLAVIDMFSVLGADRSQFVIRPFTPSINFDFAAIFPQATSSALAVAFAQTMRDVVSDEISDMAQLMASDALKRAGSAGG
ncbi:LysR substrate-binding domain-containing protein [Natronohydrobacter thiooxidans]|uniref:LysR substrate-binding domain-containing protein n=1 Tax=Natronohydrobacter thiooxidans TaxID=87172 RepID=UPI0008FF3358|nr:LysR substrate-binding domain-containing protein [Natronohydrobacter thiooxidans]